MYCCQSGSLFEAWAFVEFSVLSPFEMKLDFALRLAECSPVGIDLSDKHVSSSLCYIFG